MFTGIIETTGRIRSIRHQKIWCDVPFAQELQLGQSVACSGVCLTVVACDDAGFAVEVIPETLRRTSFSALKPEDLVNIERAMPADGRFDGHIVQGHVDAVARVRALEELPDGSHVMEVELDEAFMKYVVEKGSITLDGISLTVAELFEDTLKVGIIPHTWELTNLHKKHIGDPVNVEVDVLGKYVEKLIKAKL